MVVIQLIYIFLRSISYPLILRFLMCNGQVTHLASDHFALTSNLSFKIDSTNFHIQKNDQQVYAHLHLRYFHSENETFEKCASINVENKAEFSCKCFDRAGKYDIFVVNSSSNDIHVIQTLNVFWPLVNVFVPESHTALTGSVTVKLKYKLGCKPEPSTFQQSSLEIWFSQTENSKQNVVQFKKLRNIKVANWWTLETLTLSCKYFDREGLFKVFLLTTVNSSNDLDVISESNIMKVHWYDGYKLKTVSGSIFPCPTSGIAVTYDGPSCYSVNSRIRLWAVLINETAKTRNLKYIGEEIAESTKSIVNFGCNYFDLIYLEYCFQYATVLDDGTVIEHARQCVINQKTNFMPVHGQWSEWQEWGSCTTTCGIGVQHRIKLCDRPKPKYYGKFCQGTGMETKSCDKGLCPNTTTSNNRVEKLFISSPCQCGCHLTKQETIVIESFSCTNITIWTIEAPSNFFISAKLLTFNLADVTNEWLKIRQGFNETGRLLFDSKINRENVEDVSLFLKDNGLRIEYFSHKEFVPDFGGPSWKGAIIKINFVGPIGGMLSNNFKQYSFLLFVVLPSTSSVILLIGLCIIWCCLFKNAKRKLTSKCNLLKSRSCGSVEIDPLIDEIKNCEIATNQTVGVVKSDHSIDRTCKNLNRQMVQVIIENGGDKEKQPLLSTKLRGKDNAAANNLPQIPEEMFTSTHTQSTRLSTVTQKSGELSPPSTSVPKTVRSIGIQLSSPALPLKRQFSFGSKVSIGTPSTTYNNCHKDIRENRCESPTMLSIAGTEQDFEYDYSEYAVPGSILNPEYLTNETFLQSDISIDDIIAQSDLMKSPSPECNAHEKSSVSTQIQNDSEICFKMPKKSMKQFHFL